MTAPLIWTRTAPSEPGWYWLRFRSFPWRPQDPPSPWIELIVEVYLRYPLESVHGDGVLSIRSQYGAPYGDEREWAGPLTPPQSEEVR